MRYPKSLAIHQRLQAITPNGAQTLSKMWSRYGEGAPPVLEGGAGVWVRDRDDHTYVDWVGSLASVTLGHGCAPIQARIRRALFEFGGGTFALPHPLEAEVSERFCAMTGWEQVRWVSTGSEATEAAIRTARIATGRDVIVSIGFHGWPTPWMAHKPIRPGVPAVFGTILRDVPYGDVPALEAAIGPDVAAVILEPTIEDPPPPGYLETVVRLAHEHGALVIADEIVTGFRWAIHGAMAGYFGVRPDLAVYGKAISNGMFPIAALVGPRDLMRHAWPVSGTYGGHPLGLSIVDAVMDEYAQVSDEGVGVIEKLWLAGRWVTEMIGALIAKHNLEEYLRVVAPTPHPTIRFLFANPDARRLAASLLVQTLAHHGVLWHGSGGGNAMVGHLAATASMITTDAFDAALQRLSAAIQGEGFAPCLVGAPIQPALAGRVPGTG